MTHRAAVLLLLAVLTIASALQAQTAPSVVTVPAATAQEVAPNAQAIYSTPPTLALTAKGPNAHPGSVWLRSTDDGLHVWVKVQTGDQAVQWPKQKSEMLASDHVEVWLAAAPDVPMPAIGWGNQFGMNLLNSAAECATKGGLDENHTPEGTAQCKQWYEEQAHYRAQLKRLFARQWMIAGGDFDPASHHYEEFATAAYTSLSAGVFKESLPTLLKPKADDGLVVVLAAETRPAGYSVHLFIPYTAFPPTQQLKLQDLYFMVDVFGPAPAGHKNGDFSTTSAVRAWGKPGTFNHIQLAAPRTFSITSCAYKLEQSDLYDIKYAAWFYPSAPGRDSGLRSTFALINPEQGYLYGPGGISPEAVEAKYFWKQLASGATICGPSLAWRNGTVIKRSDFVIHEKYLDTRKLSDGWTLLRTGPDVATLSPFGAGQCGACPVMSFNVYAISPQGEIASALDLDETYSGFGDQPQAGDLAIAPDWSKITLFRQSMEEKWSSVTYCLDGHAYKQCAESKEAKPPDPPNFKELQGSDE